MKIRINNSTNSEVKGINQATHRSWQARNSVDMNLNVAVPIKYETPLLVSYGDVRDVTLGPTAGLGESGCEFARRAGTPPSCP